MFACLTLWYLKKENKKSQKWPLMRAFLFVLASLVTTKMLLVAWKGLFISRFEFPTWRQPKPYWWDEVEVPTFLDFLEATYPPAPNNNNGIDATLVCSGKSGSLICAGKIESPPVGSPLITSAKTATLYWLGQWSVLFDSKSTDISLHARERGYNWSRGWFIVLRQSRTYAVTVFVLTVKWPRWL